MNPNELRSIERLDEFIRLNAYIFGNEKAGLSDVVQILMSFELFKPNMDRLGGVLGAIGMPQRKDELKKAYLNLKDFVHVGLGDDVQAFFDILKRDGQVDYVESDYFSRMDDVLIQAAEYARSGRELKASEQLKSPPGQTGLFRLQQKSKELIKRLKKHIVGQDDAVEQLAKSYTSRTSEAREDRPEAVALFVGPPSSGKSFLAKILAQELDDDKATLPVFELEMSGLQHSAQSAQIDGTEPSYSNAQPGKLTSFVRENPHSVIVIKNMDLADPTIVARLESIFSEGILTDQYGFYPKNDTDEDPICPPQVDFSKTIVLVTTTAGETLYEDSQFWKTYRSNRSQAISLLLSEIESSSEGLRKSASKMLSYLSDGEILPFKRLHGADYETIYQRATSNFALEFEELYGIKIENQFDNDVGLGVARLLISRDLPDISPKSTSELLQKEVLNTIFNYDNIDIREITGINVLLDKDSLDIANRIKAFSAHGDWLEELLRRNMYVDFVWEVSVEDDVINLILSDAQLHKHMNVRDTRGSGAIRLEVPEVSFGDIAGHHAVKEQLEEVVDFLRYPEKIERFGGSVSKGMLLYGVPGTGKTMLAKALAHEADMPVISVVATEFNDIATTRDIFARARRYAPSILFIDELDAVGSRQKNGHAALINTLLSEIDGFDTSLSAPVFIIAATNLPENIDPALLRSGRIDLHIEVPNLDRDARSYFIDRIMQLPVEGDVDRQTLLDLSSGMSGADLTRAVSKLAAYLARMDAGKIKEKLIVDMLHQHRFGKVRTVKRSRQIKELVAYHEAGHAVVSSVLNPSKLINTINTLERKDSAGFVAFSGEHNMYNQRRITYTECLEDIAVYLAGRISEQQHAPDLEPCAGASDDLAKATKLAEYAITELGLDAELGAVSLRDLPDHYRHAFMPKVIDRMQFWLKEAELICEQTLESHWDKVEKVAGALMQQEIISGRQFYELIES